MKSISIVWRLCLKARPKIKVLHFTAKIVCGEREINDVSFPRVYRPLSLYICTNSGNVNKLVISYKSRIMHTYVIHTILLALYYSTFFSPQRAILREYNLSISKARSTKYAPEIKFSFVSSV